MTITMLTTTGDVSRTKHSAATTGDALRTRRDDVRTVPAALASERIKLTSLRSNAAVLGLTALIGGVLSWSVATFVTDQPMTVADTFIFSTVLSAVLAAVVGILLFTAEAQHGTLAAALTAQPARWVIAAAKTATAAVVGLALGATGMVAGVGGAALGGLRLGDTSTMITTSLWALLFTSLAAVLGLGLGMIVRHSAGAVSGLLIWMLVVEQSLTSFLPERVSRFLPFTAGNGLLPLEPSAASPDGIAAALTTAENALVFGGYTALALVLGTAALYRREVS